MARIGAQGALGLAGALHRPVPAARRADAGRGRPDWRGVLLRARRSQGHRRRRLGRCLEAPPLRLGVQGQAGRSRRRVRPAAAVCVGAGESAAADRLRHAAVPYPHQLDEQRQQDLRVRPGRPGRRGGAGQAQVGVLRSRAAAAGREPAIAHRARRGVLRDGRAGAARAGPRPAPGRTLRQPARLLHVRRRRGPAARPHVHADAGAGAAGARALRGPRRRSVPCDGSRGPGRLRDGRLVQRRAVRRRHDSAAGEVRRRCRAGRVEPRLVRNRPVDSRHAVRARSRPRQARSARRALHRPRQDHAACRAGSDPSLACRVDGREGRGRRRAGACGGRQVACRPHQAPERGRAAVPGVPQPVAGVHGARPGLRLGQLPLSRLAGAQGPGASGAVRGGSPRLPARVSRDRSRQRQGHRAQPLRR